MATQLIVHTNFHTGMVEHFQIGKHMVSPNQLLEITIDLASRLFRKEFETMDMETSHAVHSVAHAGTKLLADVNNRVLRVEFDAACDNPILHSITQRFGVDGFQEMVVEIIALQP